MRNSQPKTSVNITAVIIAIGAERAAPAVSSEM